MLGCTGVLSGCGSPRATLRSLLALSPPHARRKRVVAQELGTHLVVLCLFHFEQCLEQRPRVAALRRVPSRTRNFARSRICPSRCGQEAVDTCISLAHRAVVITSVHPVSGTNVVASALDELALRCVRLNARSCWTELRWHLHVVFIRRPLEARRSTLRQLAHSGRSWLLLDVHLSQDVCSGSTIGTR